jgi:hypothetical protein
MVLLIPLMTQMTAGTIDITVTDTVFYHAPDNDLDIDVDIIFDEFIPSTSELRVYMNNTHYGTIDLGDYLEPESYYDFKPHAFSYNMTAHGENTWEEYPDVTFDYTIQAIGYNGVDCNTFWSTSPSFQTGVIGASDVLGFIRNGSLTISIPQDACPENTTWSVQLNSVQNPIGASVDVTMRETCGNDMYGGFYTDNSGWIFRQLTRVEDGGECVGVSGTSDRECYLHVFDDESLDQGSVAYGGPISFDHGGVYKNEVYQRWDLGDVEWEGRTGYVRINNYDYESTYYIVYLPPSGPLVCAYTDYDDDMSEQWTRESTFSGLFARYTSPYQRQWSQQELDSALSIPDCQCSDCGCVKTISQYIVEEYQDPDNSVAVAFDESTLTVTGTSDSMELIQDYTEIIGLGDHITTPQSSGSYDISFRILLGTDEIATGSHQIDVCDDLDGDGYCGEDNDCNDTDSSINPGASEICDNKDNDCNGEIDEDFFGDGFVCVLGTSCNDWPGSVCNGTCSCTEDGLDVMCNSTHLPGDLDEICLNSKDDDCDGETDEIYSAVNGSETEGCIWKCVEGSKKPCSNDVGFCTPGERECINGTWGMCIGFRGPREETCNMPLNQIPRYGDDDCDGVIDNVFGGTSIEEAKCQCYDGNQPKPEECNGIDDDCDREIDELVCRCSEGETRFCGNDKGICKPGIQYCTDGYWETDCNGAIPPNPDGEICYNNLDDNCDGETDERCSISATCKNRQWDLNEDGEDCGGSCPYPCEYPFPWLVIAAVVIAFIVAFIVLEIKGKIPL